MVWLEGLSGLFEEACKSCQESACETPFLASRNQGAPLFALLSSLALPCSKPGSGSANRETPIDKGCVKLHRPSHTRLFLLPSKLQWLSIAKIGMERDRAGVEGQGGEGQP